MKFNITKIKYTILIMNEIINTSMTYFKQSNEIGQEWRKLNHFSQKGCKSLLQCFFIDINLSLSIK